jgi:hypothetical protein
MGCKYNYLPRSVNKSYCKRYRKIMNASLSLS